MEVAHNESKTIVGTITRKGNEATDATWVVNLLEKAWTPTLCKILNIFVHLFHSSFPLETLLLVTNGYVSEYITSHASCDEKVLLFDALGGQWGTVFIEHMQNYCDVVEMMQYGKDFIGWYSLNEEPSISISSVANQQAGGDSFESDETVYNRWPVHKLLNECMGGIGRLSEELFIGQQTWLPWNKQKLRLDDYLEHSLPQKLLPSSNVEQPKGQVLDDINELLPLFKAANYETWLKTVHKKPLAVRKIYARLELTTALSLTHEIPANMSLAEKQALDPLEQPWFYIELYKGRLLDLLQKYDNPLFKRLITHEYAPWAREFWGDGKTTFNIVKHTAACIASVNDIPNSDPNASTTQELQDGDWVYFKKEEELHKIMQFYNITMSQSKRTLKELTTGVNRRLGQYYIDFNYKGQESMQWLQLYNAVNFLVEDLRLFRQALKSTALEPTDVATLNEACLNRIASSKEYSNFENSHEGEEQWKIALKRDAAIFTSVMNCDGTPFQRLDGLNSVVDFYKIIQSNFAVVNAAIQTENKGFSVNEALSSINQTIAILIYHVCNVFGFLGCLCVFAM